MLFTHDTEVSLMGAAALVNTMAGSVPGDDDVDRLTTPDELDAFYGSWQWTGSRAAARPARIQELREVRALRPRLRELWFLDEDGAVEAVNALLRDGHALPQLVKHDAWEYHLHATSREAPLATRMAVEGAMALVDVIRAGELDRLKLCDARGLRRRARRPVQEPVPPVLRRRLRQPGQRRRLPGPQGGSRRLSRGD